MPCDREKLHLYLDGEMDPAARREVERHLGACRSCRQEMARLRLLWLEMDEPEAVEAPPALPYLCQQAIAAFRRGQKEPARQGISVREFLGLTWQPALRWASFLPGASLVARQNRPASSRPQSEGISVWSVGRGLWRLAQRGREK